MSSPFPGTLHLKKKHRCLNTTTHLVPVILMPYTFLVSFQIERKKIALADLETFMVHPNWNFL